MASNIKGITIEIGGNTRLLEKAIEDVSKTSKSLQTELNVINKLLKFDPTNTVLLAQKQKVLADAINSTSEKLKTLSKAQKQAQDLLNRGEISEEQYRALEREVERTRQSLGKLQTQAGELDRAMAGMGDEAKETAADVDGLGDKAQQASQKAGGAAGGFKSSFQGVAGAVTAVASTITAVVNVISSLTGYISETVEATKELRSDLSKLEQNAKNAGTSIDEIAGEFDYFVAITDEADSSVEALSNLLQAGFKGEGLSQAVDTIAGAVIKFPDTLKIESLADSLQETLATGQATGQYGELLERLGVNLDEFESGLSKCTTAAEKQNYAVDILAQHGLADVNREYKEGNRDLVEYAEAQGEYNRTMAEIGEIMQPVLTAFVKTKTELQQALMPAFEAFAKVALVFVENGELIIKIVASIAAGFVALKMPSIIEAFKELGGAIKTAFSTANATAASSIVGIILMVVGVVISLVSELTKASEEYEDLKNKSEELATSTKDIVDSFKSQSAESQITAERARDLAAQISELNGDIERMGAADDAARGKKTLLAEKVRTLNDLMGGTVATINEETGLLNENISSINKKIDALEEQAKAQAVYEYQIELMRQSIKLEAEQARLEEMMNELYSEKNILMKAGSEYGKEWIQTQIGQGKAIEDLIPEFEKWAKIMSRAPGDIGATGEAMLAQIETMKVLKSEQETLNGVMEDSATAAEDTAGAVEMLSDAEALRFLRMEENGAILSEAQKAQLEAYKTSNEQQYASLGELVNKEAELYSKRLEILTNTNEAILADDEKTLQEHAENMATNVQALEDYYENMAILQTAARNSQNEGLQQYLQTLTDGSAESMRMTSLIYDDFFNKGGQWTLAMASEFEKGLALRAPGMSTATYDTTYAAQAAGGQGIADNDAMMTEEEKQIKDMIDKTRNIVLDNGNFFWLGIGIINRLTQGMEQMRGKLMETVSSIVDQIKSAFNFEISASSTGRGARFRGAASGAVVSREQIIRVAEKGPEAIIPLDRLGGILQGVLDYSGGRGGGTYQLNVYAQNMSEAQQVKLFNRFDRWIGQKTARIKI